MVGWTGTVLEPSAHIMPSASELRAQKRAELGLSPQRPTAKPRVQRPPTTPRPAWTLYLLPLGVLGVIAVTLFLLMGASNWASAERGPSASLRQPGAGGMSDWSWARLNPPETGLAGAPFVVDIPTDATPLPTPAPQLPAGAGNAGAAMATGAIPRLLLSDNFSHGESIFAQRDAAGQWRAAHIPQQAIYRMEVWPGHVAWSLVDPATLLEADRTAQADSRRAVQSVHMQTVRMQTAAAVAPHTPWAYVGLIARAQTQEQMILFVVDGRGRYTIQVLREGVPEVAVPWTAAPALYPAGTSNVLTIEDDGATMRFFGNQYPLYQMNVAAWSPGSLGIASGALAEGVGESRFEWFQLYAYE